MHELQKMLLGIHLRLNRKPSEKVDFEAIHSRMRDLGSQAEFARLSSQHAAMTGPAPLLAGNPAF
jgi:hypothetical protein